VAEGRIYVVTAAGAAPRLVLAGNRSQAINHVARKTISAQVVALDDLPTLEDAIGSPLSLSESVLAK
jgi:hypothetical protein